MGDGVRFAGLMEPAEFRSLLRRTRVYVTAPRREDYGLTQLEALATAGALDCLGVDRREALWAAGALAQERPDTLPGVSVGVAAPMLPGMTEIETSVAEVCS